MITIEYIFRKEFYIVKIRKIETNIKRNLYLHSSEISFSPLPSSLESNIIRIYPEYHFQSLLGFGGAITESAGYAFHSLSKDLQDEVIKECFSPNGLNYVLCRLPIGSCDFSIQSYSYSYQENLSDFSVKHDLKYIIPTIKAAQKENPSLSFLASPWSPPAFMKSNHRLSNGGKLLDNYKKVWANYLVKYIKSYQELGIPIDYMTIQNEPNAKQPWESCHYTAEEEANLLKYELYPVFRKYNLKTKLLIWDHNKDNILTRSTDILLKYHCLNEVAGIAFHWYTGGHFENLQLLSHLFPNQLLLHTEGCTGYSHFRPNDELFNAEMYAHEIIEDFNHGVHGFIDWNILLDYHGGPNHAKNYCNSPIMISKKKDNYIKTPAFYYISHISRYAKPNAKRIHFSKFSDNICVTSFQNPDKSVMIVLLNKTDKSIEYNLCYQNKTFHDNLDSHAIVTWIIDEV